MRTVLYAVIAVTAGAAGVARAEGVPQPLISADDRGTDGVLARYSFRASIGATRVTVPDASAGLYSFQAFVGPMHDTAMAATAFRVRLGAASASDTNFRAGPLTVAMQRYFPVEPFFSAPLLGLHFGLEGAVASPWLSGQRQAVPAALAAMGVDTELAGNGWDFRPSGWVRLDFLACRSVYVEAGGGPELCVPAGAPNLVALRYRAAVGFDIGCDHGDHDQITRPGFIFEYRARGVVHDGPADPFYDDLLSGTVQWVLGPITLGATYGFQTGSLDRYLLGLRLQTGLGANR